MMKHQCSTWALTAQLFILIWNRTGLAMPDLAEVLQLTAEPDFRSVKLHWEYPKHGSTVYGFQVHYCELQAWGPNRCRTKVIDSASGMEIISGKKYHTYSVIISSLRMATNYSFEVRPLESRYSSDTKVYGKTIMVPTRGFSAKANLCLPDVSEVEVLTGPYFGGRIAVESSDGKMERCAVGGDANSAKDSYILRIEHKMCGSNVNRTTVSTFILVQENLPILTHSTRRFLVLCTFQPETLTVRAGINLPQNADGNGNSLSNVPTAGDINLMNEIAGNDIQVASLLQANEANNSAKKLHDESESHFLLVIMLTLSTIVGIGVMVWWFVPLRRIITLQTHSSNMSIFSGDSAISAYENYANSVRDTTSITEIDFGNIIEDNGPIHEDMYKNGVCNQVLHNKRADKKHSVPILSLDVQTQSDA